MSQILSQVARHLLQQQQRLTPQLIQAMDILQLNALALEERIAQELDANPALEVAPSDDEVAPRPAEAASGTEERPEGEQALVVGDDHDFERLDNLVREYDWLDEDSEFRGTRSRAALEEAGRLKIDAMANAAARPAGLQEHLLRQWALLDVDDTTRRLGALIIENLDDSGRLTIALDELLPQADPPATIERLKDALARVQQLDPAGVGARNVRECLVLQLEALPRDTDLERRILDEHFDDLRRNRVPQIAAALGVPLEEIKRAISVISRLKLHPGQDIGERPAPAVVPDVLVEYLEDEGRYDVRLARSDRRELRISPEFRAALEQARGDKRAREFIRAKIEAAASIIDAVRFRHERLLEVARTVFEKQRDFLDHGEQHIHGLRMAELAARFGCDPSTISRTVDDKWVQTPRGVYPLRRFFGGGTESKDGDALSWDSVRAKVQEIIANEDKARPLTDDEIVERLRDQGIELKRRTVAKYRAQLSIPTARQRRQY
jgi:RNA polymerase sigma-54 factor